MLKIITKDPWFTVNHPACFHQFNLCKSKDKKGMGGGTVEHEDRIWRAPFPIHLLPQPSLPSFTLTHSAPPPPVLTYLLWQVASMATLCGWRISNVPCQNMPYSCLTAASTDGTLILLVGQPNRFVEYL